MNTELMSLCLLAAVVCNGLFLPSTETSPKAISRSVRNCRTRNCRMNQEFQMLNQCSPPSPPPTPHPGTPPPCHDCPPTCPPSTKTPTIQFPNLSSVTYSTNCDSCDHDLYALTCVKTPLDCAARCAVDIRCSHFTYIANLKGGTCILKKAFGSGGAWASSVVDLRLRMHSPSRVDWNFPQHLRRIGHFWVCSQ